MLNKKMLLSLLVIGVVSVTAGAGTYAYFSDTETSSGNTFTAGTIDITVDDENPWTATYEVSNDDDGVNLKPCSAGFVDITITNVGNNPALIWKKLTVTEESDGLIPEPEIEECTVDDVYVENNDLSANTYYDLSVDGEVLIFDGVLTIDEVDGQYICLGELAPQASMVVSQSYHLMDTVTNWAQGDVMTFDMEVVATQTTGNAPDPSPVLVLVP